MSIDGYDLVMLGILAAATVLGYFKGLVWQIAWLAGIAASGYVALRFGGPLAPFFGQQAPWNKLVAMLALYVGTSLGVWLVFRVISGAISAIHLSSFDRQLGLLFGLAKGVLLCVIVTFFAITLAPGYRDQIIASRSGKMVAQLIVRADQFLPPDIVESVEPFVKQFEDELRRPAGTPPTPTAAGSSPLRAMWEGVTSAAAWTGTEQGGGTVSPAGGTTPAGSRANAGPAPAPVPPRPTASGFTAQPARPGGFSPPADPRGPQPPRPFPVGAQTPLPIR